MDVPDEHERSLAFAEIALAQIKALGQAASPRNFAIWYHYATGYNQPLNQSINEALAKSGSLSETDLEQIYGRPSPRQAGFGGTIQDFCSLAGFPAFAGTSGNPRR
jgi:hypothetical protein